MFRQSRPACGGRKGAGLLAAPPRCEPASRTKFRLRARAALAFIKCFVAGGKAPPSPAAAGCCRKLSGFLPGSFSFPVPCALVWGDTPQARTKFETAHVVLALIKYYRHSPPFRWKTVILLRGQGKHEIDAFTARRTFRMQHGICFHTPYPYLRGCINGFLIWGRCAPQAPNSAGSPPLMVNSPRLKGEP